jgi:uncharacterized iron-regulated protein
MLQRAMIALAATLASLGVAAAQTLPPVPEAVAPLGRDHPLAGQIVRLADGANTSPDRLIMAAAAQDFVLLGEKHDNPDHHRLQAWVIEALAASGRRPAVAMEMLDSDQAPALATHLKRQPQDAAGLGSAVGWNARGWPNWSIYVPIADAALRAGLPIVAADMTGAERRTVGRHGVAGLEHEVRARLRPAPDFDPSQSRSLAQELRASHCDQLPEEALPRMIAVQWARDAHMATALIGATLLEEVTGAVLIAGAGHVRIDRGVPWHLRHLAPARTVAVLAFVEVDESRRGVDEYALAGKFEYAWFTPRVDDQDPCAKFRDSLQRLRRP